MKSEKPCSRRRTWSAWGLAGFVIISVCSSARPGVLWQEGWERTPLGAYVPKCGPSPIPGDGGSWDLGDTVSCSSNCGRTQNRANIIMDGGSKALHLVTTTNSGGCAENIFLGRGGLAIPVAAGTSISFTERGQLANPQKGWGFNCIMPPCADNTHLWLQDNRGYVVVYVFQRPETYAEHTFGKGDKPNYPFGYTEVFLPMDGGVFTRDLLEDFKRIPGFPVAGAKVNSIKIEVSSLGWATFDGLRIEHVSQTPPVIKTQPANRIVTAGKSFQLAVLAEGYPPLRYQWWHNGAEIPGAMDATWFVPAATLADAGEYQVMVANIYGQTPSAVARVTVVPDVSKPNLAILTPPASVFRITNSAVLMSGTARDDVGVVDVVIEPDAGPVIHASGTTNWTALLDLHPGTNTFRVRAVDAAGNASAVATRRFFRVVTAPLVVSTNGHGRILPVLNGQWLELGKGFSLVATPFSGNLFSNWTDGAGTVLTNGPTLRFTMQPDLVLQANFVPNLFLALAGTYDGLFAPTEPAPTGPTNAGLASLTLGTSGAFSGRISLAGGTHSFSGVFDVSGRSTVKVPRAGKSTVWLNLTAQSQTIVGQITAPEWSAGLLALRRDPSRSNALAGRYSMLILGGHEDSASPPGDSPITVTVSSAGAVQAVGTLADGSAVSQAVGIAADGRWPFFVPLYGGRGLAIGWMSCKANADSKEVFWVKSPDSAARYYPGGFGGERAVALKRYLAPALKQTATTWTLGRVLMGGGNLPAPIEAEVLVTNNLIKGLSGSVSNLSLVITNGNGRFGGSFLHPVTRKATPLQGILVQGLPWVAPAEQVTVGGGWFLGTNHGGWLWLEPKQ